MSGADQGIRLRLPLHERLLRILIINLGVYLLGVWVLGGRASLDLASYAHYFVAGSGKSLEVSIGAFWYSVLHWYALLLNAAMFVIAWVAERVKARR